MTRVEVEKMWFSEAHLSINTTPIPAHRGNHRAHTSGISLSKSHKNMFSTWTSYPFNQSALSTQGWASQRESGYQILFKPNGFWQPPGFSSSPYPLSSLQLPCFEETLYPRRLIRETFNWRLAYSLRGLSPWPAWRESWWQAGGQSTEL